MSRTALRPRRHQRPNTLAFLFACLLCAATVTTVAGQAGRRNAPASDRGALLNVVAAREGGATGPLTAKDISFYEGGIEQRVLTFSRDPGPARIVLLVDNSLSLRTDVPKLQQVAREFAYEIYEGDQMLIVGYDEQAEIVTDWTDNAKQVEATLGALRKKGEPHLFDALSAVLEQALVPVSGNRKRVVVLIGDGLDRGSKTKFKSILGELQSADVALYALQLPDRTNGAHRRDQPKPSEVVRQLAEGTGGRVLPLDDPSAAAKSVCDELRNNRYLLGYVPTISYADTRRLLLLGPPGVSVRAKAMQPAK